ncbi:MAG: hypothetical protein ACYDCK_00075 [Thermoplasmatota archaeon]
MPLVNVFAAILLLSFGIFILFAGLFTAYFGAGKSRKIGIGLTLVGLIAIVIFGMLTWGGLPGTPRAWTVAEVGTGLIAVVGATLGGFVAITLFIVSIMRA